MIAKSIIFTTLTNFHVLESFFSITFAARKYYVVMIKKSFCHIFFAYYIRKIILDLVAKLDKL